MFRRTWAGLPADAAFPADLASLGYFIDENDEIKSINNPTEYFRYHINRNDRINLRRRAALSRIIEDHVVKRLSENGSKTLILPRGVPTSSPHSLIAATEGFDEAIHVVLLMGDSSKALGIIDERIIDGKGGIEKGTVIPLIKGLCASNAMPTAVIVANPGQLYWWPAGRKPITANASNELRLPSLLHFGRSYHPEINDIPGHRSPEEHLQSVMADVVARMIPGLKRLSVISQGSGCDATLKYFDANWQTWSSTLSTIVCCGPTMSASCFTSEPFKEFLGNRGRGYLVSDADLDTPIAPTHALMYPGFPTFASAEHLNASAISIRAAESIIRHVNMLATDEKFENPPVSIPALVEDGNEHETWDAIPGEDKPYVSTELQDPINRQRQQIRRWKRFAATGEAPVEDSESDDVPAYEGAEDAGKW